MVAALALLTPRAVRASNDVVLAVIVSPESKLSNISVADLRRVFQSERLTDPDGSKLIPLNHPPKTVDRVGFDQVVLGMDPETVGRFWIDRKIRGGYCRSQLGSVDKGGRLGNPIPVHHGAGDKA